MSIIRGYCVPCKANRELSDTKEIERSGLPAVEGKCTVCGNRVFALGVRVEAPANETTEA